VTTSRFPSPEHIRDLSELVERQHPGLHELIVSKFHEDYEKVDNEKIIIIIMATQYLHVTF